MGDQAGPLPQTVLRNLGDRSYDKRKNAALDIESQVKLLQEHGEVESVRRVVQTLGHDFACSTNANHRKGGLIGLAATAIGLMSDVNVHLKDLIPFVLHCFDDPESRVRYYACESLYNIAKVARQGILEYFNQVFDGLCKLFADVDVDVKNGANLLDRLIKDIVTESDAFDVNAFIPTIKKYIAMVNPYIRQLMIGWITVLHEEPSIDMLDWLPEFLDGMFDMLSDNNREIRQNADTALQAFMEGIKSTDFVQWGDMVTILVDQCKSRERFPRLQAITWVREFIALGRERLSDRYADLLGAVLHCISDAEEEIRDMSGVANDALRELVRETAPAAFSLAALHAQLLKDLKTHDTHTKKNVLEWMAMLLDKAPDEMEAHIGDLLPALLGKLDDADDAVVEQDIAVLARISSNPKKFHGVLNDIVMRFSRHHELLEERGSMIIRQLCRNLDAKEIYIQLASVLRHLAPQGAITYAFASLMVSELNLILLTAHELMPLRDELKRAFATGAGGEGGGGGGSGSGKKGDKGGGGHSSERQTFNALFETWCHNPVATFSLCLLAQAYDVSSCLVKRFAFVDVTVGFLMQVRSSRLVACDFSLFLLTRDSLLYTFPLFPSMQIDKLVQLLESPIFIHLRLELLEPANPQHPALLKSLYGLLMLLPQVKAFHTLRARLDSVSTLTALRADAFATQDKRVKRAQDDFAELLQTFEGVQKTHKEDRARQLDRDKLPSRHAAQGGPA
jgi:vacuole morphology and inheritance protein 14